MNQKKICVIANGYAEEMMAAMLMHEIRNKLEKKQKLNEYQFVGGSLVSSGKWFHQECFPTFFAGGMTPSGGFPTRSMKGFFSDLEAGAFMTPFKFKDMIKEWSKYNLDTIIVVGDFLLMMLAVPALKNKNISMVFIPTAKSDYIQSHFKIEKIFIKKYATISFPRDQITSDDFSKNGINSLYLGNMIQDLLDPSAPIIKSNTPVVALLPGSRQESYKNLEMMLKLVPEVIPPIHWAFVQASSLDSIHIDEIFKSNGWANSGFDGDVHIWSKGNNKVYCYPNNKFDSIALSCVLGISLAGTGGEQITGLGKPVIGFVGTGPQSTVQRMEDNQKLLGDAFIYEKDYPIGVINRINNIINDKMDRDRRGKIGLERMGKPGSSDRIAAYIVDNILEQ